MPCAASWTKGIAASLTSQQRKKFPNQDTKSPVDKQINQDIPALEKKSPCTSFEWEGLLGHLKYLIFPQIPPPYTCQFKALQKLKTLPGSLCSQDALAGRHLAGVKCWRGQDETRGRLHRALFRVSPTQPRHRDAGVRDRDGGG